jgi:hypothetical protein
LFSLLLSLLFFAVFEAGAADQTPETNLESDVVFCIGHPDGFCREFALTKEGYAAFPKHFSEGISYEIGKDRPEKDWPFVHPAPMDTWSGKETHPFQVHFSLDQKPTRAQTLVLGLLGTLNQKLPPVEVALNGTTIATRTAPACGSSEVVFQPQLRGTPKTMLFELPPDRFRQGKNTLTITLTEKSWLLYDYLALRDRPQPLALRKPPEPQLLQDFQKGPMKGIEEIVFAVRRPGVDGHWYANFGYYADDENRLPHKPGGKLCRWNLTTEKLDVLIDDPEGSVRDPQIHYDGKKMIFSYRPGGTRYFHLYESNVDGSDMRQLTFGPYDDIEPTYLPGGDIMFVSSRCNRWVNCWLTPVAVLYRCGPDGENIREISSNNEHDNTPWPLPNGQVVYTRWEYVDRSQVHYHHLWVTSPDGTRQTVFFGNMHPGTTMIDAKPVPDSRKLIVSFSPGHGRKEHAGRMTLLDPRLGPDNLEAARTIGTHDKHRDPWAFSEEAFMAALDGKIQLVDLQGREQTLYSLPKEDLEAGFHIHEPRPVMPREREEIIVDQVDRSQPTGKLALADIYEGRNMIGVEPGTIKKLLILETLPKPINFTGGMEPLSYGGTFTLERIVGTVPVEEDGSAYMELPALRSFFFVALDEEDRAVKRMQSFLTVMPGETTTCVGCHEQRTQTPAYHFADTTAMRRSASRVEKIEHVPDVIDFPRDVQPILEKHCVECHNYEKPEGGVVLTGDRGPLYSISYYTITAESLVADGRNLPKSNYPPYALGTGGSKLMELIDQHHEGVNLSRKERDVVRLWIDTGAPYPGTYAALGSGMIGGYAQNQLDRSDLEWPEMKASIEVLKDRCCGCHTAEKNMALPLSPSDNVGGPPWVALKPDDPRRTYSRHLLYNLTRPKKSMLLLAPLAEEHGGYESCGQAVFSGPDDPGYRKVLTAIERTAEKLDRIKRFDMPGFQPRPQYLREMKKYGILPADHDPSTPVDSYELDRQYWRSLWFTPRKNAESGS